MGFSRTIAYSYLKSPVKSMFPMYPENQIIAAPGMCFASKKEKVISGIPSAISKVYNL